MSSRQLTSAVLLVFPFAGVMLPRPRRSQPDRTWGLVALSLVLLVPVARGQCPWSRELVDLHADCICAYSSAQRLSIQCSPVNFPRLMNALHASVQNVPIDLLHVNNSTVDSLPDGLFSKLDIQSLHLARCQLKQVSDKALQGLEKSLASLSLPDNQLTEVPVQALRRLSSLRQLDLSSNAIKTVPDNAFSSLPLNTLKLADNELTILDEAFAGLEPSLKNLNLKGTGQERVPRAVSKLTSLAFLDLAQNKIATVAPEDLGSMHTLTALNLERNRILKIDREAFSGINDTLSSLSLLNNLLVEFPTQALSTLTELRVLDLGFNGIRSLPDDAFANNPFLTLLALDGNPMATIPLEPFRHLNSTLRGISIGGPYLECDCQVRWIAEWIANKDLQVTSRERNPQYCGKPDHLKRRTFAQIEPSEFICNVTTTTPSVTTPLATPTPLPPATENVDSFPVTATLIVDPTTTSSTPVPTTSVVNTTPVQETTTDEEVSPSSSKSTPVAVTFPPETTYAPVPSQRSSGNKRLRPVASAPRSEDPTLSRVPVEPRIVNAQRKDSAVVIEWYAESSLSVQVVYRLFGERAFRRGPTLRPEQRKHTLQNLPTNECLLVCVVSLQDSQDISVESVLPSQCKELKLERYVIAHLDKIIIASSAAVCGIIILAVIIFLCCWRKKQGRDSSSKSRLPPPTSTVHPTIKTSDHEWETVSMYSSRSIPRARMYHVDNVNGSVNQSFVMDDNRSHISHFSHVPNGYSAKARSTADGQSHRSYSQMSNKYRGGLGNPEVRKSQQSLSALSGNHSFLDAHAGPPGRLLANGKKRGAHNGRLASASSLHSLNEYEAEWNGRTENWKDNEVDIYVGQNHVAPAHSKYHHR
ncbi:leucine-rich repeat and fibronectin type-III domain-containing protein 3 [Ixodes scapularis]